MPSLFIYKSIFKVCAIFAALKIVQKNLIIVLRPPIKLERGDPFYNLVCVSRLLQRRKDCTKS